MKKLRENINIRQSGVVFILSVIMLFILAGLSLTILSSSISEKVQSKETQDTSLAKLAANNAISVAKQGILDDWWLGEAECTTPPCTCTNLCVWNSATFDGIDVTLQDSSWWQDYGTAVTEANVAESPLYIIMDEGCDNVAMVSRYRIVARGVGETSQFVAFADDSFSVPISANNPGDSSTQQLVSELTDSTVTSTVNLSPGQSSSGFFIDDTGTTCPDGHAGYAQCDVNCAGAVRVKAWSYDNGCGPVYGIWTVASDPQESVVNITVNGSNKRLSCYPGSY